MNAHSFILQEEVFKQLFGATTSWVVQIFLWQLLFWVLYHVNKLLANGYLWKAVVGVKNALTPENLDRVIDKSDKPVKKDSSKEMRKVGQSILKVALLLFAILIGYNLGYSLNSNYITGDISLISTVSRFNALYQLFAFIVNLGLLTVYVLIIAGTANMVARHGVSYFVHSNQDKFFRRLLKIIRVLSFVLMLILMGICLYLCATNIVALT